jgi:LacI family transcriptional regulator
LATISDVAKQAGVSPVTVSRVINNARNVSPATRERVERAIEELGYVPNVAARSLRSKRTRALALVVPDITNPFWTTVARGVEDAAQSHDYSVLLCNTDENPTKQLRYLDVVASQRVDGVIIAPCDSDVRNLAKLRNRSVPTVVIDRRVEGWDVDSVYGDSISGARALVQHLIELGHKQIAMISGPPKASTAEDRVAGYRIALAEAGIPLDPRLIRRGEFRSVSGERLTYQILDEGLRPTAIFAANNAIAIGVIDALEKRGLSIPQDVAVVCFDDFHNASRFFPFLTVVVQPAYDMGMNAAQLLLSRLETQVNLQPRHVVLPTRLLIRYSCGSGLKEGYTVPSLPALKDTHVQSILVKPLGLEDKRDLSGSITAVTIPVPSREAPGADYDKSDVNRLLKVLQHQEADRLPHLEFWVTSRSVYEYVLERELEYDIVDARVGGQSITPDDHVEFAQRLGMDAVACNFSWRPNNVFEKAADGTEHYVGGSVKTWADLDDLEPPVPLADQLSYLERYLRAAQGTGVGVFANFTSFFDSALLAVGVTDALYLFYDNRPFLERTMDILLERQEKVMRAVCDRFADDLAFVLVNDDIAHNAGLMIHPDMFHEIFPHRMKRLIAPAKERGKLVAIHTDGKMDKVLPILYDIGFSVAHPIEPESNDIFELKRQWAGKMALVGNIPTPLLAYGSQDEIEEKVREYCIKLAPGGGYVLGSSTSIMEGIPPENFVTMTRAVHKYGRYGALGGEI